MHWLPDPKIRRARVGDLVKFMLKHKLVHLMEQPREGLLAFEKAYEDQKLWSHPLLEAVRVLKDLEPGQRKLLEAKLRIRS